MVPLSIESELFAKPALPFNESELDLSESELLGRVDFKESEGEGLVDWLRGEIAWLPF